jgi:hypothetical protein
MPAAIARSDRPVRSISTCTSPGYRTIPTIGWLFLFQVITAFGLGAIILVSSSRTNLHEQRILERSP